MFYRVARTYIKSLITIQQKIKAGGYVRDDQKTVNECLYTIDTLLCTWKYASNELMANFWMNHRAEIRYLIPTNKYKGFEALLAQFNCLDADAQIYQHTKQTVTI